VSHIGDGEVASESVEVSVRVGEVVVEREGSEMVLVNRLEMREKCVVLLSG
jgi:hypothetical protein